MLDEESSGGSEGARERSYEPIGGTATKRDPSLDTPLAAAVRPLSIAVGMNGATEPSSSRWEWQSTPLKNAGFTSLLPPLPLNPFYLILGHLSSAEVGRARRLGGQMLRHMLGDEILAATARVKVVAIAVDLNRLLST